MNNKHPYAKYDEEALKKLKIISKDIFSGKYKIDIDIEPLDNKVVVQLPKVYEDTGIIMLKDEEERTLGSQQAAVLVAVGDASFYEAKKNKEKHAEIGDVVYFAKYSGRLHRDERTQTEYRIIFDKDIHYRNKRG